MRKIFNTVSTFILALGLLMTPVEMSADNPSRNGHFSGQSSQRPSNGGSAQRHDGSGQRPGGGGQRPGGGGQPGNRPGGGGQRPGGGSQPGQRPGGGGQRPGGGGQPGHRPGGGGQRPGGGDHRPGQPGGGPGRPGRPGGYHPGRPGGGPGHPGRPSRPVRPPRYHGSGGYRHPVPFFGRYHRPTPPPRWVPGPRYYGPTFGTILGVTLGTALNLSIQALVNEGYTVTSYGNNVVYLTNVPQMNYYWPDAALYYNNGALCGSTFTYPSTVYDMARYNAIYNSLYNQYGLPVTTVNQGGVISATWFGADNRYVTLEYNSNYGNYYTTLSFGY